MDPITAAIVAAVSAGALAGLTDSVRASVRGMYQSLRSLLTAKVKDAPDLSTALGQIEQRPESPARRAVLAEEIAASGVAQDPELLALAQRILDLLGEGSGTSSQVAIGSYIAQADHQSEATVTIEKPGDGH
jgi:hypothetical protein